MEFRSERSSHGHGSDDDDDDEIIIKDEKRSDESSAGDDDDEDEEDRPKQDTSIEEAPPPISTTEKSVLQAVPISASSTKKEEDDELENTKAEMGEVIEENQRLKMCLNQILNDYRTLQVQFHNIVQQDQTQNPPNSNKEHDGIIIDNNNSHQEMLLEESELVSLSLGRLPNNPRISNNEKVKVSKPLKLEEEEGLKLGLECKFETSKSESTTEHLPKNSNNSNQISPTNSSEAAKEGEVGETWPPRKVLKSTTTRDRDGGAGEDEVSQQNPAKKARVCVRARCDTPTMNDGCQWRKYGQKISKGNPCPRAYYRCTVAPSCPVRKQVQRCSQDMSILITTYEGTHNHPLPLSATAMASTTSAAASMLLSASSSSPSHHSSSIPSSLSTTSHLPPYPNTNLLHHHHHNPMNLFLSSDPSKPRQFYLSHPSSLSSSSSHPTITLDLTTTSSNPSSSSSSSAPFTRFNTNFNNNKYPSSTSLNFSSNNNPSESNSISWTNSNGFLTYNNNSNNRSNILSTMNLGRSQPPIESLYHSFIQRNNNNNNVPISSHQNSLPDTIAAATKVITADPNFQSALAAALTSIISTQGNNQGGVGENLGQKMKWGEIFQAATNNNSSSALASTSIANNIGCASSFLNKAAPATNNNTQTTGNNNLVFLPSPSLPYSGPKSASGSPGDNRDNTN